VNQINTLSTKNDSDLKKLKDFLRHEQEMLKTNAEQIPQALQALDPAQNALGIAFLLAAQCGAGVFPDQRQTFCYIGKFLRAADEQQFKKASVPVNAVCKYYAQMAIDEGQQARLQSLRPLRCALEKLRPDPETLTPVHTELIRVCLKAKAYTFAASVLDQPIYDISLSSPSCTQMTPQSFLCYFYYGAMVRIGLKQYTQALQLLLVVLTCPASCLSAIQADAYKKYVLVSLKINGELQPLPTYASHIVQRYAKSPSYVLDIAEAFKAGDLTALRRVVEEKTQALEADSNLGLAQQIVDSMQRHKVKMLTNTYLTLSLAEIATEIGWDESKAAEVEQLLFDMICEGEIRARIDGATENVSFEDDDGDMDAAMICKVEDRLQQIMGLAQRIAAFEHEVVSSEAYIRKTAALEGGGAAAAAAMGGYDLMDM